MGAFQSELAVADVDGHIWRLVWPLIWTSASGYAVSVPIGFFTDFASTPNFMRVLCPNAGDWNKAAVVHDWLYTCTKLPLSRKQADDYFYEAMQDCGVGWWTRQGMYWTVRLCGHVFWANR